MRIGHKRSRGVLWFRLVLAVIVIIGSIIITISSITIKVFGLGKSFSVTVEDLSTYSGQMEANMR